MWFKIPAVRISPDLLAGIVVGVGVFLVILIVLCICLCCRRKNRKSRNGPDNISVEDPPEAQGNHEGVVPAQQRQQQNRPPRKAKFFVVPDPSPSLAPAAAAAEAAATPLQRQASLSSTAGSSLAPPKLLRRESSNSPPSSVVSFGSSQIMFTYEELAMATNGFSKANVLGQGGFGFVHKGYLPNGKEVAVKSLNDNSKQGEREFKAEVETISRVHHRHLVSLVGYCVTGSRRLLVYEFVPNKTLEFHLHGKGQPSMDWATRMKVALGTAKGLAYLHEDCYPRIIHRDIKAANILLDDNFQAKVADFGLAKFASEADTHVSTRVMGTLGYLAPEYASSGKLTEKSDVYSFGVILLELITGHIPVDRTHKENILVDWARPLFAAAIEREDFKYLVDSRLQDCYKRDEMARMVSCAATCVRKSSRRRPLMSQVIRALEGNISISEIDNGITPGRSMVNRFDGSDSEFNGSSQYNQKRTMKGFQSSSSEYSDSQYTGEPRALDSSTGLGRSSGEYVTSEHDRTSSEEYGGLSRSNSTCEGHTVRELDTEEVKREIARFKLHRIRP